MTELATWLRTEIDRRGLTQSHVAAHSGVGQATLSLILKKGHIPRNEVLFRLADYFDTDHIEILRLAGFLKTGDDLIGDISPPTLSTLDFDEVHIREVVDEYRQIPDEWKPAVLDLIRTFARLATQPPSHIPVPADELDESQ
jgi:transcriptional regulator with XRE-family HTH domain